VLITGVIRAEAPLAHALLRFLPSEFARRLCRAEKVVYDYGARAITNMRGRDGNVMNLFGQMLAACDSKEKASISDDDIRNEAGNLIVAGSDTIGTTLTYLVWAVLKQPELQVLLENEVAQFSEEISLAELEAAPILNSVLNETLRLYGAAPGALPRIVPSRGLTVGEHHIPAGVEVSTQAYTNHRDPAVFPDPLR
jgi:cytochrome P450